MLMLRLYASLLVFVVGVLAAPFVNAQSHFASCLNGSGNIFNATIIVPVESTPDINGTPLSSGSEVAVFSSDPQYPDLCAGVLVWNGNHGYVTVWGDDELTPARDGLMPGEAFQYRVWDKNANVEYGNASVQVTYAQGNGVYGHNAMAVLSDLSVLVVPSAPALATPSDGASGVSVGPTLTWNAAVSAASYSLQVASDDNFNNVVFSQNNLPNTSFDVTGLAYETTYYWRVQARNTAGNSAWSSVWHFATEQTPVVVPSAPTLARPLDGASGISISPNLSWNAAAGADSYTLQVASDANFNNVVFRQGSLPNTSFDVTGLAYETTYYWRVQARNTAGNSAWSSVWHFATEQTPIVAPPAPSLLSPPNASTGVTINPTLTWNAATNAEAYRVQVTLSTDPGFSAPLVDDATVTELFYDLAGLAYEKQYLWRVQASNTAGPGSWSTTWHFTTENAPIQPPTAPVLATPSNGASNVSVNPTLAWNAAANANYYRLQIAADANFGNIVVDESALSNTTYAASDLNHSATYFWRVQAGNVGGPSPWSTVWQFATENPPLALPGTPNPRDPSNRSSNIHVPADFTWDPSANASTYHVQVSMSRNFTSLVVDESNLTGTSAIEAALDYGTKYFWRIRASNASGNSPWSSTNKFITENASIPVPEAPTLASPSNGAANISANPTLTWNAVNGADSYRLKIASDPGFNNIIFSQSGLTGTSHQVVGLDNETQYYWHVRAGNAGGDGPWSSDWSFTTEATPPALPDTPQLRAPYNHATGVPVPATVSWYTSANASAYQLQIATSKNFSLLVVDEPNLTNTFFTTSSLESGKKYFWRVRARNAAGNSPWSSEWSLTTEKGTFGRVAAPPLVEPANGASNTATSVLLVWATAGGASAYRLQMSERDDFSKVTLDEENLANTTFLAEDLDEETTYYWRVQAGNYLGSSDWTRVQHFTTGTASGLIAPRPMRPAHATTDVTTPTTFVWQIAPFATSYRLQVMRLDAAGGVDEVVIDSTGLLGTTLDVNTLYPGADYIWHVKAVNARGEGPWSDTYRFTTRVGMPTATEAVAEEVPHTIALHQNYPNPFNPETTIVFDVPSTMHVTLKIYDMLGKEVATLVSQTLPAGNHQVKWNARGMPTGIYLYQLRTDHQTMTRALTLIK